MRASAYNAFCKALPHATHVNQWDGADVWKIGGKVFAIYAPESWGKHAGITFKVTPMSYELLQSQPGLRPAPYFASRGIKWIQRQSDESMSDADLKKYLRASYDQVLAGLSKKKQAELAPAKTRNATMK